MAAAKKLRAWLEEKDRIVVCPRVYDGITARIVLNADFECLYMTAAGTTISKLGMDDLGIATLNDTRENAGMIAGLDRSVPLIADADTGYGGPIMVRGTTEQHIQVGVAAFYLEDQVVNKRCGHLKNKELVDEEVYLSRIHAAVNARAKSGSDIVIIARTDSLQSLDYEAAVSRLKAAVAVGADVAFLESFNSVEEGRRVCAEMAPTLVLLNMVAGGVTLKLSVAEAKDMGFKIMIYPAFGVEPVYQAVAPVAKELFEVCGLKESIDFDIAAGGKLYKNSV